MEARMINRKLGNQGLEVPAIGLGCMGMSIAYGVRVESDAIATIDRAIELNAAFLDTSDAYGNGKNAAICACRKALSSTASRTM
jgi:aryl-alcohol dehydrogenase-like predicted oxidoreductase